MDNEQLWQAILGELEVSLTKANFTTWFKNTFILSQEDNKIYVAVPNAFTKTWLENKYCKAIISALKKISHSQLNEIYYKVTNKSEIPQKQISSLKQSIKNNLATIEESIEKTNPCGLSIKYTFDNFIVGKFNELAYAASRAVAKNPGRAYNPLFIYGGAGLGKTHLLQAIGQEIIKNQPEKKVLYVTSEQFTNQFIFAIRSHKTKEFQQKFRKLDVLIIDDIQFVSGKEQTQEQLFHTFNDLHQENRQIILSSDRTPRSIPDLEQRLESRFEWGMIADIKEPDIETKIAIIEAKLLEKKFSLGNDEVRFLAERLGKNIRELEGVINKVIAYHNLDGREMNLGEIKDIVQSISLQIPKSSITSKKIIKIVADFYDITINDVIGESRKKELVEPRQIIMYLIREEIGASFPNIGHELGGRDHTTAMHAHEKIKKICQENDKIKQDIILIKQKIYNE